MKIGIIGYQGSGKSTLFEWLTGAKPDPALAHASQSAMATVPEPRVEPLCQVYHPKKITLAALELVDTPGLSRTHEGNAARLGLIREAGCLVLVVAGFTGGKALADLVAFDEDFLLADMEIVGGRIERLKESLKKPRPKAEREHDQDELAALEPLLTKLEAGQHLSQSEMTDEQLKATSSFRLLTQKPKLVVVNLADDDSPDRFAKGNARGLSPFSESSEKKGTVPLAPPNAPILKTSSGVPLVAIPLGLEVELARMTPEDRAEFEREMGVGHGDRDSLLRTILNVSGQMLYFTSGDKEVRTWMLRQGGTALEAADNIHSDLARGFIRAEVMQCEDLIRLGSEREIKAHNLMRQEPKDYVIRDGDILHIRFSV
jgi:ribosome-binding ATPase